VTVDPDQATYLYGEVITLTATADQGWTFSAWSDDATGSNNPVQVTMDGDKSVTATFTQDQYTLDVNSVGNGQVTADPAQATYLYGDVITLTATADPGWTFSAWSDDATGSSNPVQVTMDGDKSVTATFTEDQYTLDVDIVGNGQVTVEPDQATYLYGEVITLTATADPNWEFSAWNGSLTGNANPGTLTVVGTTVVTATFSKEVQRIYVPFISQNTSALPDLVVDELSVSNRDVQTVYLSQGSLSGGPSLFGPAAIPIPAIRPVSPKLASRRTWKFSALRGSHDVQGPQLGDV